MWRAHCGVEECEPTLHTVGMAIVVGTRAVIDLRLLGVGEGIPLRALHGAPRLVDRGDGPVLPPAQGARNVLQQQARFDDFLTRYNMDRPHQALGMKIPADLFRAPPASTAVLRS